MPVKSGKDKPYGNAGETTLAKGPMRQPRAEQQRGAMNPNDGPFSPKAKNPHPPMATPPVPAEQPKPKKGNRSGGGDNTNPGGGGNDRGYNNPGKGKGKGGGK